MTETSHHRGQNLNTRMGREMMQRHSDRMRSRGWRKGLAAAAVLALGLALGFPVAAASQVTVIQHLYLLTPASEGRLNVQERVVLSNTGAVLPEGSVKLYLPKGAVNVTPHAGGTMEVEKDAVIVRSQIPAGKPAFDFGYTLSYTGAPHYQLRLKSDYATEQVIVLAPAEGVTIEGEGVADGGVQKLGETQYRMFTLKKLAPGSEVILTALTGDGGQMASFWGINAHLLMIGGIVLVVAVVVAAVVIIIRRRAKKKISA